MLYATTGLAARSLIEPDRHSDEALARVTWLDLLNPTDAERALVERATGLIVPAMADLAEIETSSRLNQAGGILTLSTPMSYLDPEGLSHTAPLGFVLSKAHLITIRFVDAPAFATVATQISARGEHAGSCAVFVQLLEAMVDRLADILEHIRTELDIVSHRVFRPDPVARAPAKADVQLRATLRSIGRAGDRLSNLRDSLLGVQRIVLFSMQHAAPFMAADDRPRLITLKDDISSLTDYDTQLSSKVQFLLDATLGFINIEQNNNVKILTVVSVVGVPPTLVASIYGMNFKNMPELDWAWGYPYALCLIVLTALVPLVWFRRQGWI